MTRKMFVRFLPILLVAMLTILILGSLSASVEDNPTIYKVNQDGSQTSLDVGAVVAEGIRVGDDCANLKIEVGGSGKNRISETTIGGIVDANCVARVQEIEWKQDGVRSVPLLSHVFRPSEVHAGVTRHYRGFTKATMRDFIFIDLAWTMGILEYHDNGSALSNGDADYDCGVFELTGWSEESCEGTSSTSGTQFWFSRGEGEYENDALEQFDKWSVAEYDAWPGGWTFYCNWSDPAPGTYWACVRTRLQLHTH